MDSNPIVDTFTKYFQTVRALTPQLGELAYNIRYQVYCQEFKYEPEENFPDQQERDEYDQQSQHCLIIHKPTGIAAGCVRLIVAGKSNPSLPLPFERHCSHTLNPAIMDLSKLDRFSFGEISRLAVINRFRRRKTDEKKPVSIPDERVSGGGNRLPFPLITVSLVLSILAVILNEGYQYGFCMMEPRLAKMLARHRLIFDQIGNMINYHGFRGPFVIKQENILRNLTPQGDELMEVIQQQLSGNTGTA